MDVRASDKDRDDAAAALGEHWTEGRLTQEELDRRVGAVYTATTRGELDDLLRDLPAELRREEARPRARLLLPGNLYFQERADFPASRQRAFDQALESIVPALGRIGYHLATSERPALMRFTRRRGLRGDQLLTVMFLEARGSGTRLIAFGEGPRSLRKAFTELAG